LLLLSRHTRDTRVPIAQLGFVLETPGLAAVR